MNIVDIIIKKRNKEELTTEEINYVIENYTKDNIKDYQISSLLMAIFLNGMTDREIFDLTTSMVNSGDKLDLSNIDNVVDKHSTGGIGDKTTLIVGPIVAACGAKVAKISKAHENTIECITELSNGNIATCGNDFLIKFWEKTSPNPYANLTGHTGTVLFILQLKNGLLSSASADKTIRIWDIKNLQTVKILSEHQASVLKLYQLKNPKFISCSVDGTLRIWDPFQNYTSSVLKGHKDAVESVVELENGVVASCSLDEHIRIWDTYMKKCKKKIRVRKTLIDIDYYITGDLLVISGDKRLMIINYELGKIINEYVNSNEIYCLCHSPDGKIFLGCNKGEVRILNKKFQNITTLKIHNDVVSSMKLFKNQMLATSSWDGSFAISV